MKINWSGYSKKRKKQQAVHGYLHVTTMNKAQALMCRGAALDS